MKSPPYFWMALQRTKVSWRFQKILWPSQNIWTLPKIVLTFHFWKICWCIRTVLNTALTSFCFVTNLHLHFFRRFIRWSVYLYKWDKTKIISSTFHLSVIEIAAKLGKVLDCFWSLSDSFIFLLISVNYLYRSSMTSKHNRVSCKQRGQILFEVAINWIHCDAFILSSLLLCL